MGLLIAGVAVFIGAHLLPSVPSIRGGLRDRLGVGPYMGLFSLVALTGLILIILGMGRAPSVHLWTPPAWGRQVAIVAMPVAVTLFIGAYLPSNLKRFIRHPMLLGVALWATVHLLANGDLASLILFGSFGAFAAFDIWSANRRGAQRSAKIAPLWQDVLLLIAGGVVYMGILHGHGWLFGMPVAFSSG
jgi:uncharacterized membrane protein